MFVSLALTSLLASFVRASVTPLTPAPGDIFNEGTTCHIAWSPDTTGLWKTLNIELMTGSNLEMIHLTTVATVDGTTASDFDYPCLDVTPNSAIYFYQFTSPNSTDKFWTGRFAIADPNGHTVPPTESTQPDDSSPVPWGTGALADPSLAVPPPPYLANGTTTSIPNVTSTATSLSLAATTSSTSSTSSSRSSLVLTMSTATTSSAASTVTSPSASSAVVGLVIDHSLWHSSVALGLAAFVFVVLL